MAKDIVRLDCNSHKVYELDKGDAMDMLCHCQAKAEALAFMAPNLCGEGFGENDPAVNGLSLIMHDLADDLEIVAKVLWDPKREKGEPSLAAVLSK